MDEFLKELIKLQEAVVHLKEIISEIKEDINKINNELDERSEEIKDNFYIAETTRKRVDEVCEDIHRRLDTIERIQDKEEVCYSRQKDSKDRTIIIVVQAIVTIGAIVYAFIMHHIGAGK